MLKKFTILSSLAILLTSIFASFTPTVLAAHYDGNYYAIADIATLRQDFLATVQNTCGNTSSGGFMNCVNNARADYISTYGDIGVVMYAIGDDYGTAMLSSINPAAETIRFYTDTVGKFKDPAYEYENFFIFWLDQSATASIQGGDHASVQGYIEPLVAGETPQGVHLLYASQRGAADWFTVGEETRVEYAATGDFVSDSQSQIIVLMGYDTEHTLHYHYSPLSQCFSGQDYIYGNECDREYYTTSSSSYGYYHTVNPATAEDLALIRYKELERVARAAESAAREAEERAAAANQAAKAAEERAIAAEAAAKAAEAAAHAAENDSTEAKNRARLAEEEAAEARASAEAAIAEAAAAREQAKSAATEAEAAKSRVAAAEQQALEAEQKAAEAAAQAASATAAANAASAAAKAAQEQANVLADHIDGLEARLAAAEANLANATTELSELRQSTTETIFELTASLTSALTSINELRAALATAREELVLAISQITPQTTIVQNYAVPIAAGNNESSPTPDCPCSLATTTTEASAESPEPIVPLGGYHEQDIPTEFPWWLLAIILPGLGVLIWWFFLPIGKTHQQDKNKR